MKAKLRSIDGNGKLVEAFDLVLKISKNESSPYMYLRKWFVEHYSDWAKYVLVSGQEAEA